MVFCRGANPSSPNQIQTRYMYTNPHREAIGISPPKSGGVNRKSGVNHREIHTIVGLAQLIHTYIYIYIYIYKSNLRENRLGSSVEVAKYAILYTAKVFRSLPLLDKCGASVTLCLRFLLITTYLRSTHIAH